MAGQFELAAKHLEVMKQAKRIVGEINANNSKDFAKELIKNSYGEVPSQCNVYDDYLGLTVAVEEIAKVNPGAAYFIVDQVVAKEIFVKYAPGKADTYLKDERLIAVLCNESGMDRSGLATKAEKTESGWKLQGNKSISDEQKLADAFIVAAKDDKDKYIAFYVKKEQLNIEQVSKSIAGAEVILNQLMINLELKENQMIAVMPDKMERIMTIGKTLIAGVASGISHSSIITSVNAIKGVKDQKNTAVSTTQGVQFTLADMYSEAEGGRILAYNSAAMIDENKPNIKFATMAKVQASDAAALVATQALQMLGNIGYISGISFADSIKSAVTSQIKGGTNRVLKNQIYDYMLAKK